MSSAIPVRSIGVTSDGKRSNRRFDRFAWLRWIFGLAGIAFLVIALEGTWRRSQGLPIPTAWAFLVAGLLTLAALICLARAWIQLLGAPGAARPLAARFFASQLGRYIPGAIWQPVAQVGLAGAAGVSLPQASTAFAVHALIQVAAGGIMGVGLAIVGQGIPVGIRVAALLGLVGPLLLQRRWLVRALLLVARIARRKIPEDLVPSQGAILTAFWWTLAAVVMNSVTFAILLGSLPGQAPFLVGAFAFAFAWLVGFLAVPFPSGIGVREAMLLVTIGYEVSRSHVIAASVSQRLVLIAADIIAISSSRLRVRRDVERGEPRTGSGLAGG